MAFVSYSSYTRPLGLRCCQSSCVAIGTARAGIPRLPDIDRVRSMPRESATLNRGPAERYSDEIGGGNVLGVSVGSGRV